MDLKLKDKVAIVTGAGSQVAAGTASALALQQGVSPKKVAFQSLRKQLIKQGVPLPDVKAAV